jgi:hypothetical protein
LAFVSSFIKQAPSRPRLIRESLASIWRPTHKQLVFHRTFITDPDFLLHVVDDSSPASTRSPRQDVHFILSLITDPEVLAFFVGHFISRADARQTYANMSYKSFAWFGVHEIFIFQTRSVSLDDRAGRASHSPSIPQGHLTCCAAGSANAL